MTFAKKIDYLVDFFWIKINGLSVFRQIYMLLKKPY
jgi:hypothetical protein